MTRRPHLSWVPDPLRAALLVGVSLAGAVSCGPEHDQPAGVGTWQEGTSQGTAVRSVAPRAPVTWTTLDTDSPVGGRGNRGKNLNDVCFWDDRTGFAAGDRGVYRTEDGGMTWRRLQTDPQGNWTSVRLTGRDDVWIAGQRHPGGPGKGLMRRSQDGGRTWTKVLEGEIWGASRIALAAMRDPPPNADGQGRTDVPHFEIWVVSSNWLSFHSPDQGATWRRVNFGGASFRARDICFPGDVPYERDFTGYTVGETAAGQVTVLKTTDAGRTWGGLTLPESLPVLGRIFFTTSREGWVGGHNGTVLCTRDGGETWERRDLPESAGEQSVTALWFLRSGPGWAAVHQPFDGIGKIIFEHTLFYTPDGGRSWRPELSGRKDVHALWSNGPGTCWAVGNTPAFVANDFVAILTGEE